MPDSCISRTPCRACCYKDYDEFYERTFMPLQISNEELLNIPPDLQIIDPEDAEPEVKEEEEETDDTDDFDLW